MGGSEKKIYQRKIYTKQCRGKEHTNKMEVYKQARRYRPCSGIAVLSSRYNDIQENTRRIKEWAEKAAFEY